MTPDEERAKAYLDGRGLVAEPFTKAEVGAGKTPDFRVYSNNEFQFFCEVKSSEEDHWIDDLLEDAAPGEIVEDYKQDPIYNKLTAHIHKAVKQLDAVNRVIAHPNVLVLINHDDGYGFLDLLAVLTGNFYGDDGTAHQIYWQFSEGRIKEEKRRVHLYIWLDDFKPDQLFFAQTETAHHDKLCRLFNINPKEIKQIGT